MNPKLNKTFECLKKIEFSSDYKFSIKISQQIRNSLDDLNKLIEKELKDPNFIYINTLFWWHLDKNRKGEWFKNFQPLFADEKANNNYQFFSKVFLEEKLINFSFTEFVCKDLKTTPNKILINYYLTNRRNHFNYDSSLKYGLCFDIGVTQDIYRRIENLKHKNDWSPIYLNS